MEVLFSTTLRAFTFSHTYVYEYVKKIYSQIDVCAPSGKFAICQLHLEESGCLFSTFCAISLYLLAIPKFTIS